jgi:hypothetical protein
VLRFSRQARCSVRYPVRPVLFVLGICSVTALSGCAGKPQVIAGASLASVACSSDTSCMAVGISSADRAFSESWNGHAWHVLQTPSQPGSEPSQLSGVSCVSADKCIVVGLFGTIGHFQPLSESWNGSRWSIENTPTSTGIQSYLSSVDCLPTMQCLATGYSLVRVAGGTHPSGLFERWDGRTWALVPTPSSAAWASLADESCTTPTDCMIIALHPKSDDDGVAYWDGSSWIRAPVLKPPATTLLQFQAISCWTSGCIAVGTASEELAGRWHFHQLAESWNHQRWSTIAPPRAPSARLTSLFCSGFHNCVAVGSTARGALLAERWNGHGWTIMMTLAAGQASGFNAISCTSVKACMAVGFEAAHSRLGNLYAGSLPADAKTIAERWNGKRWSPTDVEVGSCLG